MSLTPQATVITDAKKEAQAKIDAAISKSALYLAAHTDDAYRDFRHAEKHFSHCEKQGKRGIIRFRLLVSRPVPVYRGNDRSALVGTFKHSGCDQYQLMRNMYRKLCPAGMEVEFGGCTKSLENLGDHLEDVFYPTITFIKRI
jgi:hypothetical protein